MKSILSEALNNLLLETSIDGFYKKQYSNKMNYETYKQLCNIDPTTNGDNMGKYCMWILREFINEFSADKNTKPNNFVLNTFKSLLEFYNKNLGKIKANYPEYADITKLDFNTLYKFYQDNIDAFELSALAKEKSKDALVVYNDADWTIVIPLTWEASKKYGANTKWCTTDTNDDIYFNLYSRTEPLFINIDKIHNTKWQFSLKRGCFFDAKDHSIADSIYGANEHIGMPNKVFDFYKTKAEDIITKYREERGMTDENSFSYYFQDNKNPIGSTNYYECDTNEDGEYYIYDENGNRQLDITVRPDEDSWVYVKDNIYVPGMDGDFVFVTPNNQPLLIQRNEIISNFTDYFCEKEKNVDGGFISKNLFAVSYGDDRHSYSFDNNTAIMFLANEKTKSFIFKNKKLKYYYVIVNDGSKLKICNTSKDAIDYLDAYKQVLKVKNTFNNVLERISKNYNNDKLLD